MKKKSRINRISIFLDEVGLDQLELAELLDVAKDTVGRWCRNVAQPSLKNLRRVAELGHVDVRILLEPMKWDENDGPSPIDIYLDSKAKRQSEDKKTINAKKK
ncbi:helix-turn-helix transcriptional regulator [Pedobacter heparinus]|uniref:helix-turn-helix transcriptional regulator n=1 Tax=Pedobacter heparinus TaxID=984 RepID=UPI002931C9E1|nr:helix-turn-helix transcriptional regulator [Pedobacter heparinus]